jgi:hypothetical protein
VKTYFLAITLLALVLLGSRSAEAQASGPYYYSPYWDAQYQNYLHWQAYLEYLRQYDPYYELHVMHYQLYRPPSQAYQVYPPCCYAWDVTALQPFHAPQAAISPPTRAGGSLPPTVGPPRPATRRR